MRAVPLVTDRTGPEPEYGEMWALGIRRKLGVSAGYGFASLGAGFYGDPRKNAGIYQKRVAGYNQNTGPPGRGAPTYHVLMRTYRPTNPRTTEQQAQRQKLADAVAGWQGLTTEQKANYNEKASRHNRRGYDDYKKEFMRAA